MLSHRAYYATKCNETDCNDAMKTSKLKRHLHGNHSEHKQKDLSFFKRKEVSMKWQKLEVGRYFVQNNVAGVEASFEVAFEIAKQKNLLLSEKRL